MGKTLAEKVWQDHVVVKGEDGEPDLLYIDLQLIHEVTSPQAFDGLRQAGRPLRRRDLTIATEDHNTPTIDIDKPIADLTERNADRRRCAATRMNSVFASTRSATKSRASCTSSARSWASRCRASRWCAATRTPRRTVRSARWRSVSAPARSSTCMATQTLPLKPFKTMAINVEGELKPGVTAKDIILAVIAKIGTGGGAGYVLEYRGERDPRPLDGGPDDDLQHVDRGRRPRRNGRPRRDHLRVRQGPRPRPEAARTGTRPSSTGRRCAPTTTQCSTPRCPSTRTSSSRSSRGAPTRARACR